MVRGQKHAAGTSDIEIASPVSFRNISIYPESAEVDAYIGSSDSVPIPAGGTLTITDMNAIGNVLIERSVSTAVYVWMW